MYQSNQTQKATVYAQHQTVHTFVAQRSHRKF